MKKLLAMLLTATMIFSFAACKKDDDDKDEKTTTAKKDGTEVTTTVPDNAITGDVDAKDAFVIWAWNDDIKPILDGPFKAACPEEYKRIVFVNCGGSNFYQPKIDEILKDKKNKLYPDLMLVETDCVKKYANDDKILPLKDIGITADDYKDQYKPYVDLGTSNDGKYKASYWQATPGCMQVRADFAKKYLGTDDPKELQEKYFSSYDKIIEAAKKVAEADPSGKVTLFPSYQDLYRPMANTRKVGWYDKKDKIKIDDNMKSYMDYSKKLFDCKGTHNLGQWSGEWQADMNGDGVNTNACVALPGCPWFTYWCLKDAWNNNTILCDGPAAFFWGGTGMCVPEGTCDKKMAATIVKTITMNKDVMKGIYKEKKDFLNNKSANEEIAKEITAGTMENCPRMYNNQNFVEYFLPKVASADASTVTAEDANIMAMFQAQNDQYAQGKCDQKTAINKFIDQVHDTYSYLKK